MPSFFKKIAFFLLIFSFFIVPQKTLAITIEECEKRVGKGELNTQELGECERIFSDFLSQAGQQKQTLKNEIDKFNAAISLTTTRIYTTSKQIEALEKEISDLGQKINRLDISLDQISQVLIRRIAETYKKGRIEPLTLLFSSDDFSDFVSRWKYLRVMQAHDKKLMIQLENVRTNYEDQKNLKEEKQAELEAAKKKLESQKAILAQEKTAKENLLRITQNNEKKYQELLAKAAAEVRSLKGFTSKQTGGILPPQNSPDGWFYSQRDERWANKTIGLSSETIFDVGCLVSSVAMIFKYYGQNITPLEIASNPSYFFSTTAYMLQPWPSPPGKSYTEINGISNMDKELAEGKPVIVHLRLGGDGHFVVIKKKEGDNYIMHDPWHGYDKNFKDFYSIGLIDKIVVFK